MSEPSLYAGAALRRLRRREGLTQASMAQRLSISPSYLNLIERNQRPVTARVVLELVDQFDYDPRSLQESSSIGGVDGLARRLGDDRFADLGIDRAEVTEFLAAAPQAAAAFARLFDERGRAAAQTRPFEEEVWRAIERWRNHFADLDEAAENLADELRLARADIGAALTDHLRERHDLAIRYLPRAVLPEANRRLDLHARQVQLSEMLSPAARNIEMAKQVAELEQRELIADIADGASFDHREGRDAFARYLRAYYARALVMPYGRFLRACEATAYEPQVLARRFATDVGEVARRFTTLQRVGQRGLPFFVGRIDGSVQLFERLLGASGTSLLDRRPGCPRLGLERRAEWHSQAIMMESGALGPEHWLVAHIAAPPYADEPRTDVLLLGLEAKFADATVIGRGVSLKEDDATPIGPGRRTCRRIECPARSLRGPIQTAVA